MKILILNGPNLNLQGRRDTDIYGTETFEEFKSRIRSNTVDFGCGCVNYSTASGTLEVSYDDKFNIDGKPAEKEFARYDSKFCKAERKADSITVDSGKSRLLLDFKNAKRSVN